MVDESNGDLQGIADDRTLDECFRDEFERGLTETFFFRSRGEVE